MDRHMRKCVACKKMSIVVMYTCFLPVYWVDCAWMLRRRRCFLALKHCSRCFNFVRLVVIYRIKLIQIACVPRFHFLTIVVRDFHIVENL